MPSNNGASTIPSQITTNKFFSKSHTDSVTLSLQYTFIVDNSDSLISDMFDYARYGIQAQIPEGNTQIQGITPNIIYTIKEVWNSWGNFKVKTFYAKIVDGVEIKSTDSDTLVMTIPFQIQGDN